MNKPPFIIIEGGDGTGKTLQAQMLSRSFENAGFTVCLTHEPGSSEVAEQIRKVLLGPDSPAMSSRTELFLFEAARSAWVEDVVSPALRAGNVVITDRSFPSTVAYQGYAGGIDLELINQLNRVAMEGTEPDLVIIIDLDYDTAEARISQRGEAKDRIERKPRSFHDAVYRGYREYGNGGEKNVVVIEGRGTVKKVHASIVAAANDRLGISLTSAQ